MAKSRYSRLSPGPPEQSQLSQRLLSLRADGAGGSFSIDGTVTNSGGGTLSSHAQYHLSGTRIGLDEADPYATPEILFNLTDEVGYQFDTDCVAGSSQWRVISKVCYST
jgi:hypothetical protein